MTSNTKYVSQSHKDLGFTEDSSTAKNGNTAFLCVWLSETLLFSPRSQLLMIPDTD